MKRLNYIYTLWIAFAFIILSCSKFEDNNNGGKETGERMQDLTIDQNFDWSAGLKGKLTLNFDNPNNVSIEGEIINIVNSDGIVVKRAEISSGEASFQLNLPQNANYSIYYPVTGDEFPITELGIKTLTLGNTISDIPESSILKDGEVSSCSSCENPLINAGGEVPVIGVNWTLKNEDDVPGWKTTASDKKIEIWTDGFLGKNAQEGRQFFELNANLVAALYQELCLNPGSTVKWSVYHRGRNGVDVAIVKIGETVETAELQETMSDGSDAWGYYEGTYTVPEDQTTTVFMFESVSAAGGNRSVGNLLDNFEVECDFDGDGTKDDDDDDPDNGDVSYISYFPTSGKQIVAFEDLWPSLGDFDFNDMTLSNKVKINKDQNFKPLSAEFTVSIDAIGATIHNGIGMMLYDENKEPIGTEIISSVTGDASKDPNNENGLILSQNVFTTIGELYKNNGVGPSSIPDTLKFVVNFNNSAIDFLPELYIFRSGDRTHEIHRADFPATSKMNTSLFNTSNDAGHFKSTNGLPWGFEIYLEGDYASPIELVDMLAAYPQFKSWVESGGTQFTNWYEFPSAGNVFVVPKMN